MTPAPLSPGNNIPYFPTNDPPPSSLLRHHYMSWDSQVSLPPCTISLLNYPSPPSLSSILPPSSLSPSTDDPIPASAQDYKLDNGRRRVGGFDEDAIEYDYDYGNALPAKIEAPPPPPRRRVVQPALQRNQNQYGQGGQPSRSNSGLSGKDACQSGAKSVAHESACDLFYECYEGQGFLQSCPNGLIYANDGRYGLIKNCDYPHNANCNGRPERSKYFFLITNLTLCMPWLKTSRHDAQWDRDG